MKGFGKLFYVFLETVGDLDGCSEFCEKIARWDLAKLFQSWMLATEPMENGFTVLNHGDVWVNNLLLSTDDALFIDFQMCFHGSPASDLLYFLTTSVCDDVKVSRFDHLVEFYHSELCISLSDLGYEKHVPTLEELHQDLLEKGSFGKLLWSLSIYYFQIDFLLFSCSMLTFDAYFADCQERCRRRVRFG